MASTVSLPPADHRGDRKGGSDGLASDLAVSSALAERLAGAGEEKTRRWWERYLKGAVPFRGSRWAPPAGSCTRLANDRAELLDEEVQIDLALAQFAQPYCEDKLAGVLALTERLLDHLTIEHVPKLAQPFELGHIEDWSTCDWYCVKVVGRFVANGCDRRQRAEAIADWRHAEAMWQRRAAAVSFVNLAPGGEQFFSGFTDLLLRVCARNVEDPTRFSQTSVGWLLRELSKARPEAVQGFVSAHRESMSTEALKAATARLPKESHRGT